MAFTAVPPSRAIRRQLPSRGNRICRLVEHSCSSSRVRCLASSSSSSNPSSSSSTLEQELQPQPTPTSPSAKEWDAIREVEVVALASGEKVKVKSLWETEEGNEAVAAVLFLTHFGDFSSWELGQKVKDKVASWEARGVRVICIGLGTADNADAFAKFLDLDPKNIFADTRGECHSALNFPKGFAPNSEISGYVKLFPMLMGIGSPGTIQEVLRGYFGDRNAKQIFDSPNMFDVLGSGYQRPFELATLRLQNMIEIIKNWDALAPKDSQLLTWQGGAMVFRGKQALFRHDDRGILTYVPFDAFADAVDRNAPSS